MSPPALESWVRWRPQRRQAEELIPQPTRSWKESSWKGKARSYWNTCLIVLKGPALIPQRRAERYRRPMEPLTESQGLRLSMIPFEGSHLFWIFYELSYRRPRWAWEDEFPHISQLRTWLWLQWDEGPLPQDDSMNTLGKHPWSKHSWRRFPHSSCRRKELRSSSLPSWTGESFQFHGWKGCWFALVRMCIGGWGSQSSIPSGSSQCRWPWATPRVTVWERRGLCSWLFRWSCAAVWVCRGVHSLWKVDWP